MSERLEKFMAEKAELTRLIQVGFEVKVNRDEVVRVKGRKWPFFGAHAHKTEVRKVEKVFRISEPTLGTLSRMSKEILDIVISEENYKDLAEDVRMRKLVVDHADKCARIIALAVIGSEYNVPKQENGMIVYYQDNERVDKLTELFLETLRPSDMFKIMTDINVTNNMLDFSLSIRLMSTQRTSAPSLIDERKD